MHKKLLLMGCLLLLGMLLKPLNAANIHVRYFESADFRLDESSFQIYSFSALENEHVTLIVYGLEDGVIPAVSVFDINGITLEEDLNLAQDEVAGVEFTAPVNGLYTALVSRQTETGGLIRVMLFEGDPLEANYSFLDTIDPLLPSRAYFVSGSAEQPVEMTITVLDDASETTPLPQIFASRGTEISPPPLEERINPIEQFTWENDRGDVFYTLNIRTIPEELPTSRKTQGFLSQQAQFLDLTSVQVDVGAGIPEPDFLPRPICTGNASAGTPLLAGPSPDFKEVGTLTSTTLLEIIGSKGDYFLVVDLENPQGGSFVLQSLIKLDDDLQSPDCSRVQEVEAPRLTDDNRRAQPPQAPPRSPGANTTPAPSTDTPPITTSPADNECNPGGAMAGKCDSEWEWTCGWYLARFNDGTFSRGQVIDPCTSLLPPLPPPEAVTYNIPSVGCNDIGGISVDFGGGFSATPTDTTYSDPACTFPLGILGNPHVYAPPGYDPNYLCQLAFGTTVSSGPAGNFVYQCN